MRMRTDFKLNTDERHIDIIDLMIYFTYDHNAKKNH